MGGAAAAVPETFFRAPGRSVTLFLVDGRPDGLVKVTVGGWNGQMLAAPRGRISDLLHRPESPCRKG